MLKAPSELGTAGRKLWRDICTKMAESDTQPDARERQILLLSACILRQREAELAELLKTEPMFTEGSKGQLVMHPAIVEARDAANEIAVLLCKIDLAPLDDDGGMVGISDLVAWRAVDEGPQRRERRWGK